MSMNPLLWYTNRDDYFHAKRKFDNTKDGDKLSIPYDHLKTNKNKQMKRLLYLIIPFYTLAYHPPQKKAEACCSKN